MTKSMLVRSVIVTTAITALAGCSSISSTLGLERHVPDETQVTVRPALTLPPDFNLTPPGTETAVSGQHEEANPNAPAAAADGSTSAAPQKEERGFFGSLFHGDFFGNDVDATTAPKPAANAPPAAADAPAPALDANGAPQTPAPAPDSTSQAPAPATK